MPPFPPLPTDSPALPTGQAGRRHLGQLRQSLRKTLLAKGLTGKTQPPARVALLGASAASLTLAAHFRSRGLAVSLIEEDTDAAARLTAHLARLRADVTVSDDAKLISGAALVIETSGTGGAAERLIRAAGHAAPDAVLAALTDTAAGLNGAARLVALRLIAPGSGLVEVLERPGFPPEGDTGPAVQAARMARAAGCWPVRVPRHSDGAGLRLLARFEATAEALIFAGAPPWELDAAAEAVGFAQGPCALMDRLGVDTALPRRARLIAAGIDLPDPGVIARMVAEGRLGRRASVGWFRYPGGGGQVTDPLIEDLVREEAWFARRPMRDFDAATLGRHLLAALIDESARLLAEGAVAAPGDPDLVASLGLGFPPALGGPVWLAGRWGGQATLAAVLALENDLGGLPGVPPAAPALRRAALTGQSLTEAAHAG